MGTPDIFARIRDVVSVERYQRAKVVFIGAGAVNSPLALRLAQHGVRSFVLIDHDRVELENAVRLPLGAANWGELKVEALKYLVEAHIPGVLVEAIPERFGAELGADRLDAIFSDASLVICSTDELEANAAANRFVLAYDIPAIFATVDAVTGRGEVVAVLGRGEAPCYECYIAWRRADHENRRGVPMALATMEPTHGFVERLALGLLDPPSEFFTDIFSVRPGADRVDPGHPPTVFWITRPEAPHAGEFTDGPWRPSWSEYHPECPGCGNTARPLREPPRSPVWSGREHDRALVRGGVYLGIAGIVGALTLVAQFSPNANEDSKPPLSLEARTPPSANAEPPGESVDEQSLVEQWQSQRAGRPQPAEVAPDRANRQLVPAEPTSIVGTWAGSGRHHYDPGGGVISSFTHLKLSVTSEQLGRVGSYRAGNSIGSCRGDLYLSRKRGNVYWLAGRGPRRNARGHECSTSTVRARLTGEGLSWRVRTRFPGIRGKMTLTLRSQ